MKRSFSGYLNAIASGAFYGAIPVVTLFISRSGSIPSTFSVMVRMLIGALLLLPFALPRLKKSRLTGKFVRQIFLASVLMTVTSILLYTAYQRIPSGVAIALHYTYPLIVMCLNVLLFGVRVDRRVVLAMLLSIGGVVLLCDLSVLGERAISGIMISLISACTFSTYLLFLDRQKMSGGDSLVFTTLLSIFETLLYGVFNLAAGCFFVPVNAYIVSVIGLGGLISVLAILTQILAVRQAGSVVTSILSTLEPIVCAIGSALVLREAISARTVLGTALVLAAVILVTLQGRGKAAAKEN